MKILVIALLAAGCIGMGYMFSLKYKKRYVFFKTLVMICQKLDVEINYSRERLKNLFTGFDDKTKKNLQGLDKNFLAYLENNAPLDEGTLFKGLNFLKQGEKDVILTFFRSLGRSDLASQSKELKNFEARFDDLSQSATSEHKKYGSLCLKLGIVAALVVVVLLV